MPSTHISPHLIRLETAIVDRQPWQTGKHGPSVILCQR
jgi:hypothetical protein